MNHFVIGVSIFILVYVALISERVHKTIAALLGASAMLFAHVLSQEEAFFAIDLNVILLLVGMMIIVHIMSLTGVFQWGAIRIAQLADGRPLTILIYLSVVAAFVSSLLDNVTTMILMSPIVFLIADELEIDPVPFLLMMVIASNIGGAATLIGDPPNILIGSAAKLSFIDFILNLTPVIGIILVFFVVTIIFFYKKTFHVSNDLRARLKSIRAVRAIKDWTLLWQSLTVLTSVIVLFLFHNKLGLEAATVVLGGASLLLLFSKKEPEEVLRHVEWTTLFFFIGLFIIVEGLVKVGFIESAARFGLRLTGGNRSITCMGILWFSAIFSAIVDNIPYTATMIPLVKEMGQAIAQQSGIAPELILKPLWWALALGACLGGNGTLIGASANVVVVDIARKNGYKISFMRFFKYGIVFMLESMIISSVYIYFRYLM